MINGFYLDESGNTGFGDMAQQPIVCYGGILVPNSTLIALQQDFSAISMKIQDSIKGMIKGVSLKDLDHLPFFKTYEIHSKKFFDGDNLFSKISDNARFQYAEEMLALLTKHNCKVLTSVIHKETYKDHTGETSHINMHQLCISEAVHLLDQELIKVGETAVIVPDEGRENESELLVRTVRQETQSGRILCNLFPQESHIHPLVQIADIVVFLTAVFYRNSYGSKRKKFNDKLTGLYQSHVVPLATVWEYRP